MNIENKGPIKEEITFRSLHENFYASIMDYQDLVIRVSGLSNDIKTRQEPTETGTPVAPAQENSLLVEFAQHLDRINELNHRLLGIVQHLQNTLG